MPESRSSSADSRGSSAGKRSNSSGSVLSRVLGSFRHSSRNGDATANSKEDPNWANNYKITHHPDRPRHDRREGLRHRNSMYVLDQLRRIWKYNGKMTEMKRREKAASEMTFAAAAAAMGYSDSQNQGSRDDERHVSSGNLQADQMPNFSRKASSPVFAENKWQVGGEEQRHQYNTPMNKADRMKEDRTRPASSPVSISAASDKMTIRVGLELESLNPYIEEGFGGLLKTRPGRAETESYSQANNEISAPPPAPKFFTPLPVPSQSTSPFLSLEQKEAARKPQRCTLPHSLQQQFQAKPMFAYRSPTEQPVLIRNMQMSSAREKALRNQMAPLRINTDQDKTPSLVVISSPASEQASPVTPTDDASVNGYLDYDGLSTGLRTSKTCPMPLCGNSLRTTADQKQNLCAECRSDLQPRQSIFRTDVLNPVLPAHKSSKGYTKAHASLISHVRYDSTAKVAEVKVRIPQRTERYINDENETRTVDRGSGNKSKKDRNDSDLLSSRFNKGKGQFRLQPAPFSRKHTRIGHSPTKYQTTEQDSATPLWSGRNDVDGSSHIGFQLAGWGTVTPSPTYQPLQRKLSGPLLEPKTYRPATSSMRKNSAIRRRPSELRRRAKGAIAKSNSGRALPSQRARVEKRDNHRATEPTSNVLPPPSSESRKKQHHVEHQAVGRDADIHKDLTSTNSHTKGINKKFDPEAGETALTDEDIYREIDNIIDCYLRLPDVSESENEKRKTEAIASYFAEVPLDVEMKIKGFI
ncbi:hypothetical protein FHL15_002973 [Xylaria flabelliformis]|uniref:Uncharacterized protein n=1 Tax=Xylaria flabelliformis TaxID=2512241 RepID=A0A553I7R5_9PEZI|nr:hypothetical protein FHL15_002973 [Xylaria flabelliformis]